MTELVISRRDWTRWPARAPLAHWAQDGRTLCGVRILGWQTTTADQAPILCSRCARRAREWAQWAASAQSVE